MTATSDTASSPAIRSLVVGVAGGIMGAAPGAAGDLGIKDEFRQRVQDMLQPGTSAIMVIVRKVTPDKFIEALKPYG
ncbi:MAG TPA: DUF1269 domain-containing protein, partial [Streptosporangiaceae bacterium]|nr:DUF1269 domain-containing protein [Streptosporangiaceae bacterium]